ncbi:MAG: SH3 domain-containing protein, partial [Thermomicrobiales bacterium]
MFASSGARRRSVSRTRVALATAALAVILTPSLSAAQTTTTTTADPVVFASSALNLRKGPGSDDAILTVVPLGGELLRGSGAVTNDYAPVTYDGVTGWVVAGGLVATQEEVTAATGPDPAPEATDASLFSGDVRYTLRPLMLRGGPSLDAEALTGMPEGAVVTLTQEGAENGYV